MPTERLPEATLLTVRVWLAIEPVNCGPATPPNVVEGVCTMLTPVVDFETSMAVLLPPSTKLASVGAKPALMMPVLWIELTEPDWSMMAPAAWPLATLAVSEIAALMVPVLTMLPMLEPGPIVMAVADCAVEAVMLALMIPSLTIDP